MISIRKSTFLKISRKRIERRKQMADNKKNIDEVQKEAMKGPRGRGKGGVIKKGTAKRVIKMVRSFYPVFLIS